MNKRIKTLLYTLIGTGDEPVLVAMLLLLKIGATVRLCLRNGGLCGVDQLLFSEILFQGLTLLVNLQKALVGKLSVFLSFIAAISVEKCVRCPSTMSLDMTVKD